MPDPHLSHFALHINGSRAPRELHDLLLDCTVENSLHLPDSCTIRFHDNEFHWLDSDLISEGHSVEVRGGQELEELTPIFHGEIVAIEMDMAAHGVTTAVVRCFDRSHRLHRGRLSRSFVNVKDSDIVHKIGRELGFTIHAEQTAEVHDWILQNNQTNWEFLQERAAYNGFRLYVQGERDLYFHKVKSEGDRTVKLDWGMDLRSFRPRRTAAGQVDEVMVRGWDPHEKQAIVGKCKQPSGTPKVGDSRHGGEVAKKAFGSSKMVVVDRPIHTQREADDLARSVCDEIAGTFLQAEGLCYGRPDLKPGHEVHIENIGKRFSGKYYVTSTTHTYSPSEGYATMFSVDGKTPSTLLAMLGKGNGSCSGSRLGGNIVVGVVTDNKDPKGQARVKVKYPWLTEEHTSFWARQSSQMAGKGRGMFNIPELGDEVLVAFEHGDVRRPYILGQLWNGKDGIPSISGNAMHGAGSVVNRRGLYSRVGHMVDVDDTGGAGIKLTTAGGVKVHLTDDGPTILCSTPGGQSITITDSGSLIKLQDNAGDVMTMSNGMVNVTASTMMNLNAPMINISGAISVTINGIAVTIDAGALAAINAGALASMVSGDAIFMGAGAMLKVEVGAETEISSGAGIAIDGGPSVSIEGKTITLN